MSKISIQTVTNILLKIVLLSGILMFMTISLVYAGSGGGGSSGGSNPSGTGTTPRAQPGTHAVTADRNLANQVARDLNSRPNSMCSGCSATVTTNRDGTVSVSVRQNDSGGNDSRGSNPGTTNPTPTTCNAQPNLQTIDIFFVPAGAQPVTTPARTFVSTRNGTRPDDRVTVVVPASTSYTSIMVPRNQLEAGFSYEPIIVIRNVAACSTSAGNHGSDGDTRNFDRNPVSWLLAPVAYAGGGTSGGQPNDYPNFVRNQLPFGSGGSFPIRARIDVGNNTTYEWEHYINAIGPVGNGRTLYLRLPAFTTTEAGTHSISIVTDIRHNIDAGRGCYASTTSASAGWGCVRETRETDNDRNESFTTTVGSTSLQLAVDVSDVIVRASSTLTEVPFVAINNGRATINEYQYRIVVGATPFAHATQTTSLAPTSRETVRGNGSFRTPTTPTSLPLTVCARVATSSEVCDTARLIVTTPQCSDARDNEPDGTQDANDPGCYDDPLDPTTYDPNDDNEGDMATTSPSVTIEFKPVVNPVRYNTSAALAYIITGPAPMTCVVTGGGTNSTITHTPPRTTGQVATTPVTSTQQYTLRCTANVGGGTLQFERTTTVDVLPQIQET